MKILTDLHTHTLASSHAYSTLTENAAAARAAGLEAIGMTDHCGTIPDSAHIWHFMCLHELPDYIDGVRILKGAEVNITDIHGTLDMDAELMGTLDIIIASIHSPCYSGLGEKDHTEAYMTAVENPCVDIIGHSGSPKYRYDYPAVIRRAGELGKMIEINAKTFVARPDSVPICKDIAAECKKQSVHICVDSDAHFAQAIGKFANAEKLLEELNFPEELIANRSLEEFAKFMATRKKIRI